MNRQLGENGQKLAYLKANGFSDLDSKTNLSALNRVIASHKTSSNKSQNRSFSSTPSMTICVKQVKKLSLEIKVLKRISLEQKVKTLMGATWDSNLSWNPTVLVTCQIDESWHNKVTTKKVQLSHLFISIQCHNGGHFLRRHSIT